MQYSVKYASADDTIDELQTLEQSTEKAVEKTPGEQNIKYKIHNHKQVKVLLGLYRKRWR
jgi:hypothetical protein